MYTFALYYIFLEQKTCILLFFLLSLPLVRDAEIPKTLYQ